MSFINHWQAHRSPDPTSPSLIYSNWTKERSIKSSMSTIFLDHYSRQSNLGRLKDSPAMVALVMGVWWQLEEPKFRDRSKIKQDFPNDSLLTFETPQILWQGCYNKLISNLIVGPNKHMKKTLKQVRRSSLVCLCCHLQSGNLNWGFLCTMRYF